MAGGALHLNFLFHSKIVEDTPGSSGMRENRATPEIQQMSMGQYCPVAGTKKVWKVLKALVAAVACRKFYHPRDDAYDS